MNPANINPNIYAIISFSCMIGLVVAIIAFLITFGRRLDDPIAIRNRFIIGSIIGVLFISLGVSLQQGSTVQAKVDQKVHRQLQNKIKPLKQQATQLTKTIAYQNVIQNQTTDHQKLKQLVDQQLIRKQHLKQLQEKIKDLHNEDPTYYDPE